MLTIKTLKHKNMTMLKDFNARREGINSTNENFLNLYERCNFLERFLLRKQVRLLMAHNKLIGFIWCIYPDKNTCDIKSMEIAEYDDLLTAYYYLLNSIRGNRIVTCYCEGNNNSIEILKALGFCKTDGTIEMYFDVNETKDFELPDSISFHKLKRGEEEKIRCNMQNEIFENEDRIPLSVEDIIFDEEQNYYLDDGAIFIKENNIYVGYGQIISDNKTAIIVNFGIKKEFRGKGYGKCLIKYLVKLVKAFGYDKVFIKVDANNKAAIGLYEAMGFIVDKESYNWELKK